MSRLSESVCCNTAVSIIEVLVIVGTACVVCYVFSYEFFFFQNAIVFCDIKQGLSNVIMLR